MTKVIYVGLDVHAETIAVATADEGRDGEVRFHGVIANTTEALKALSARLSRQGTMPDFCYEAGPCGYGVHRCLTALGHRCTVVAPCLIPRKAGDRVKTDRRDAQMLARLHRAGELQAVWTPDEAHEAMRDLIRARKQAVEAMQVARQQLQSFLLRHGLRFPGRSRWSKAHWRWLDELRRFPFAHQQLVFEEQKRTIRQIDARVATLDAAIVEAVAQWRFGPVVDALRCLRGVDTVIAATLVAEIGDISRFDSPRQLMAYGPTRSHHQSGQRARAQHADRGQLVLSAPGPGRSPTSGAGGAPAGADPRHRLESADALVQPVPSTVGRGQAPAQGDRGCRARARRVRLEHHQGAAAARLTRPQHQCCASRWGWPPIVREPSPYAGA